MSRVESITLKFSTLKLDFVEKRRVTYRSPLDVAHYLSKKGFYEEIVKYANRAGEGGQIVSYSMITKTFRDKFLGLGDLSLIEGAHYITFTQGENEDVSKFIKGHPGVTCSTIHEAQGETFDDVVLVRLKANDNVIYPGGKNQSRIKLWLPQGIRGV